MRSWTGSTHSRWVRTRSTVSRGVPKTDQRTPWEVLLGLSWDTADWGARFDKLVKTYLLADLGDKPRDWMWPAMTVGECEPCGRGGYSNAPHAFRRMHKHLGHEKHFTLHSPWFFVLVLGTTSGTWPMEPFRRERCYNVYQIQSRDPGFSHSVPVILPSNQRPDDLPEWHHDTEDKASLSWPCSRDSSGASQRA